MTMPKDKRKQRSIYYFRCEFTEINGMKVRDKLEVMINSAWHKLNSTRERAFYIGEGRCVVGMMLSNPSISLSNKNRKCTVFSIGVYEEGASANTINKPSKTFIELEAGTYDAPSDKEYLDGESFVCVLDNHLVISPASTIRTGTINKFLEKLLNAGGYSNESSNMDIQQIADIDSIKKIKEEGVSNIVINGAAYLSSLEYINRTAPNQKISNPLKKLANYFYNFFDMLKDDDSDSTILENAGLNTRIQITHDGRISGTSSECGQAFAQNTAELLASSNIGGYVITTKNGTKLTNEIGRAHV